MKYYRAYTAVLAGITSVFLLCFPFLMYLYIKEPEGMELLYFAKRSRILPDVFLYYKEIALLVFSLFLLTALVLGLVMYWGILEKPPGKWKKERSVFGALGIYFLCNIISVLVSEYREYGRLGNSLDYEGLAAIGAYMVLFIAGYVLFTEPQGMRFLKICLCLLMLLLIAGTFLELLCGPLMNIEWIQERIVPEKYSHLLDTWVLRGYDDVSLTFSNPGFFGGFCAMLLPIGLGMAVADTKRSALSVDVLLGGGMLFCIFMSGSTGALYGAVGAILPGLVLLCRKQERAGRLHMAVRLAGCLICTAALLAAAQLAETMQTDDSERAAEGVQTEEAGSILQDIFGKVGGSVINRQYEKSGDLFEVEKIRLENGTLYIQGEGAELIVEAVADASEMTLEDYRFLDGERKPLEVVERPGKAACLAGSRYEDVSVSTDKRVLTIDLGYQDPVRFYAEKEQLYYIDFNGSLLSEIPQPALPGLEVLYPLFTGRGYLWISSLPILKGCLILGKGIGAFPFVYEQSEVAGMLNVHGSADYCVEQAHSWYLQTAVSSGMLSLLCMLYVFWKALQKGVEEQLHRAFDPPQWTDFLVWGLLAYMIAGIVNNSCVAAAPIFWILMGVHFGRKKE